MRHSTSKRTLTLAWAAIHRIAGDTIDDERGSAMVSLLMTNLKPAPAAPRFAAAGLTSVMRRGGSIDAANVGYCPFPSKRWTTNTDLATLCIVT